jgi:23S rRNA (pseudouridine1915-N3)-methyltransferase
LTWRIIAAGKPALDFARLGIEDYAARLATRVKCEIHFVKPGPRLAERMLDLAKGTHLILLDERGRMFSSRAFANEIQTLQNRGTSRCTVMVGPADGWDETTRTQANLLWSLGPQTLQHELALLITLEQLHRTESILSGSPYHRD